MSVVDPPPPPQVSADDVKYLISTLPHREFVKIKNSFRFGNLSGATFQSSDFTPPSLDPVDALYPSLNADVAFASDDPRATLALQDRLYELFVLLIYTPPPRPNLLNAIASSIRTSPLFALRAALALDAVAISPRDTAQNASFGALGDLISKNSSDDTRAMVVATLEYFRSLLRMSADLSALEPVEGVKEPNRTRAALARALYIGGLHLHDARVLNPFASVPERILRVVYNELTLFSTFSRAPYIALFETAPLADASAAEATRREGEVNGFHFKDTQEHHLFDSKSRRIKRMMDMKRVIERVREESPIGESIGWGLCVCLVKARADVRVEMFASQCLKAFSDILEEFSLPAWVRPYEIIPIGGEGGLLEVVRGAVTLNQLKGGLGFDDEARPVPLGEYFEMMYGGGHCARFKAAQQNFINSVAGYTVFCYLFQVKDRHNDNIMIDRDGHIIHIDFGFLLDETPGVNIEPEFKLTREYVVRKPPPPPLPLRSI
jgi:hypothetical protein